MYQCEDYYILYSKMNVYKRRVDRAKKITQCALAKSSRPLVSFSGGKDSIVMLDIICQSGFFGEMVFFKYGLTFEKETPKETLDIVNLYAKKYKIKCNIISCKGEFDCWNELGYFCILPESEEEKRIFNQTNHDFYKKSKQFEADHGCDLSFIGLRKEESKKRKIMLCNKGNIYKTKERESITCCPIANFTADDIWAYIYSNELKYPSFYDHPNKDRGRIRNEPCLLYSNSVLRNGVIDDFKDLFPDYIAEIKKRYPNAIL